MKDEYIFKLGMKCLSMHSLLCLHFTEPLLNRTKQGLLFPDNTYLANGQRSTAGWPFLPLYEAISFSALSVFS